MRVPWRRRARAKPPLETVPHVPTAAAPAAPSGLTDIEAQAQYHRDRLALYRARMHGSHATSTERLHELERAAAAADERLKTARRLARRERPE